MHTTHHTHGRGGTQMRQTHTYVRKTQIKSTPCRLKHVVIPPNQKVLANTLHVEVFIFLSNNIIKKVQEKKSQKTQQKSRPTPAI